MPRPSDIRQARAFLRARNISSSEIPPRLFALTSERLKKPFKELLRLLAILKMGTQGRGQSPTATEYDSSSRDGS